MSSLRHKATSGVFWSAIERFAQQAIFFVVQIVLARILQPEEFGLIAMTTVFVAISNAVIDSGFSNALIQKKEITEADRSTVFYFNIFISVCLWGGLWMIAPHVAYFYGEPELERILPVLGLSLVVAGYGGVHRAVLNREMQFKRMFWVSTPSVIISGSLGIMLAFKGYGVWALVAQIIALRLANTVFIRFWSDWSPQMLFSFSALKQMFSYGSRLALSNVLDKAFSNIYVLVIGKVYAPAELGFFQRAQSIKQLPMTNLQAILGRVAFPLFSSIQEDVPAMKRGMVKALQLSCFLSFPLMMVIAAVAEPFVTVLLGEKWLPAVPYLRLLCVLGCFYPYHTLNLNLLMAMGRSDVFLRLEVIKKILVIVNVSVTFRFGIIAMIYGMFVTSLCSLFINSYYTKHAIGVGIWQQVQMTFGLFVWALSGFAAASLVLQGVSLQAIPALLLASTVSGLVLLVGVRMLAVDIRRELGTAFNFIPAGRFFHFLVR